LEDSSVVCISGTTYEVTKTIPLTGFGDANRGGDNGAYDPNTHLFYAAVEVFTPNALEAFKGGIDIAYSGADNHVHSGATIDIVDTKTGKMVGSMKNARRRSRRRGNRAVGETNVRNYGGHYRR